MVVTDVVAGSDVGKVEIDPGIGFVVTVKVKVTVWSLPCYSHAGVSGMVEHPVDQRNRLSRQGVQ
jgi:hypothetical protein